MPHNTGIERNKPKWDSGLGYLILLDQEIKLANDFLINAQWPEYYRTLESWYITVIYWLEKNDATSSLKVKDKDGKEVCALEKLKRLRASADESQIGVLKNYHEMLDRLTSLAGLRLASTSSMPGILQT